MLRRKSIFEVVPLAQVAHLVKPRSRPRVLSVTYDHSLASTREMLFVQAGFGVSSFMDTAAAIARCDEETFDVIVVGHSIPLAERKTLVKALRYKCSTPILALTRPGEPTLIEADYLFDPAEPPSLLVETVKRILVMPKQRG